MQRRPIRASRFLRGVLPEGAHLQALAALAAVATNDTYGLLARYGRDIAGALVITTEEGPPSEASWGVEPYSAGQLEAEVAELGERSLGVHADSELSIAGLQNKLLLVGSPDGGWGRPVHGYPSTHILKVDDDRYPGLVLAEADCLRLAQRLGLTDVDAQTTKIAGADCAPLYDTVPTMLWPRLRTAAAMSVNSHSDVERLTIGDVVAEADGWGLDVARARRAAIDVAQALPSVVPDAVASDELATRVIDRSVRLLSTSRT